MTLSLILAEVAGLNIHVIIYVVCESPPYEVTETGWGEFQLQIKVIFQDAYQKPIMLSHNLKLYPTDDQTFLKTTKPVISEKYEELVFDPPTHEMREILMKELRFQNMDSSHRARKCMLERMFIKLLVREFENEELLLLDKAIEVVRNKLPSAKKESVK